MGKYPYLCMPVYVHTHTHILYGYEHVSIHNFEIGSIGAQIRLKHIMQPRLILKS